MSDKIKTIREALKFGDHVTYADNHFAVVLNAQPEFDQYEVAYRQHDGGGHEYWKTAVCHLSDLSALDQLAPTAEIVQAGDAMRKALGRHVGIDEMEATQAWDAAKSQPPLDIPEAIKALGFIKEYGERKGTNNDRDIAIHMMVKWANHGIASLTP